MEFILGSNFVSLNMSNSKIKVGLVSYGMSGRIFHAPFIEQHPNFELRLILERTKSNSKEAYPNATIVRSFDALIKTDEVDLIVVNGPTYLHFEMAKAALEAGKHVVLEKPMTATVQEGEALIALAKKHNVQLAVYHNKRFEGGFKTIQKLLATDRIGTVQDCTLAIHRFRPEIGPKAWKEDPHPGAGILYDIGSHLIDQVLMLFGWPVDLKADLQIQRANGKVVDYFKITFLYADFKATIVSDMLTNTPKPSISLLGTKGSFVKYGYDPQESRLAKHPIVWEGIGEDLVENYGTLTTIKTNTTEKITTENGDYGQFYQNVYEVLNGDAALIIPPVEALDVIKIIEWATESGITKNQV
ncbi:Gfo/Idh/MocA family oxidoreductase [Maribacter sp. HTCC2170]|uniref:Gfo/Idh/MocA family oxidoreductase n=1 Tax=Maribacter sp. (strain HTCC2170 / KCCM 42371) TaxID=313603 RepID=UPI00006B483E|nr:Gfo/Idh/MocA family oxidoreductase [Maribacter sp. HTCC2170]EAR01980.1 putative oxidoreductase [Maribacter sp. HTCC2170]